MTDTHTFSYIQDIQNNIQKYNVIALLQVLISVGYSKDSIFFVSNNSWASSSSQIEKIDFDIVLLATNSLQEPLFAQRSIRSEITDMIDAPRLYLFDLSQVYVENLNKGSISVKLREKFLHYGYVLSQRTYVEKNGINAWIMIDPENKHQYSISLDDSALNVYLELYLENTKNYQWLANFKSVYSVALDPNNNLSVYKHRKVTITINMGLFGSTGLLPTYFSKLMDSYAVQSPKFQSFLAFFDNQLIKNYLSTIYPEYYRSLFFNDTTFAEYALQDLEIYQHTALQMLPTCVGTLHWLFKSVYPELEVQVEKFRVSQKTATKTRSQLHSLWLRNRSKRFRFSDISAWKFFCL
jgi:hypothetical protein